MAHRKVAMLGRINLLEGVRRYKELWREEANKDFPLSKVLCFAKRQTLWGKDTNKKNHSSLIFFAWFVWDKEHKGSPTIEWIKE